MKGAPRPDPFEGDPVAEVRRIAGEARSSFALGMRLMARPRRDAMHALYAFARVADDIADGPWPLAEKRAALDDWADEIDAAYRREARSAIGRAVSRAAAAHALPAEEFHALIDGMRMDAEGPIVAPDERTFRLYCRRVAGSVGLLSMRVFGAWRGEVSGRFALALADALQIVNILRDVAEDARLGRLYLPLPLLERHGVPTRPEAVAAAPELPALCAEFAAEADAAFAEARALASGHDRRSLVPAMAMMGAYEATLAGLRAGGFRPDVKVGRGARLRGSLVRIARG